MTIVSAGAVHSPAILLRSGIGVDDGRPVGANLMDHAATPGFEVALVPEARLPFADTRTFTSMLRYTSGLADAGPNDMQILWFDGVGATDAGMADARIIGAVMRVFSRGRVRLRSNDPTMDPIVEFRLLSDDRDVVRLRDAVRRIIELVRHPAVTAVIERAVALETPLDELDSDDAIGSWLREHVTDYMHAAGTCRMGATDDPEAVVDTECRVIGYDGLRVCDASVLPDVPKANTHLTTVAIAERIAEILRAGA